MSLRKGLSVVSPVHYLSPVYGLPSIHIFIDLAYGSYRDHAITDLTAVFVVFDHEGCNIWFGHRVYRHLAALLRQNWDIILWR